MAIRSICIFPDPILTRRTQKVITFNDSLMKLVEDMVDTMRDANGVGLAANQIGESLMLCVIEIPEEEEVRVLVNPQFVSQEGGRKLIEGCLSVPGYQGQVFRFDIFMPNKEQPIQVFFHEDLSHFLCHLLLNEET